MVRKFLNQNYSKLKRDLQRRTELFTDPRFPPNASSLFFSGKNDHDIVWKRPREICDDPRLVVDGLAPSDLNQGELGNCWFVAACSALALEKKLWDRVVPNVREQTRPHNYYSKNRPAGLSDKIIRFDKEWNPDHKEQYCGIFHFHFWHFGKWVDVVVDDWLPTKNGHLVFMKSKSGNEFWSALLEKAYAKLAGSYEALAGGLTGDALVDFTGGINEVIQLREISLAEEEDKKKDLFTNLQQAHEHQSMMSCSISLKEGESPETATDCGLIKGHAYTVTDIRKMKLSSGLMSLFGNREKLMMIKMRNPWGEKEWNGAWSDKSEEWERVPKKEKDKMELKVEDDGEFWMEFHDWCQWFTSVSICRIVNTSVLSLSKTWHEKEFHGKWEGLTAGGCVNHRETFLHNPQYSFTLAEDQEVMISLMQKDPRRQKSQEGGRGENFSIGYLIMQVEQNRKFRLHTIRESAGSVTYTNKRSMFGRFNLKTGQYVIVPSTFEPEQEREFLLRMYSEHNTHPLELKKDVPGRGFLGYLCCCCVNPPQALVTVKVISAVGLEKQDMTGAGADPYCKITCEGTTVTTPVRKNTLEPQFDATAVFYVKNPAECSIKIQVWNHKSMVMDRFMGQVMADLPNADRAGGERRTLRLMNRGRHAETESEGSITFNVTHQSDLRAT